eukprot:GHVP01020664.1.p1 GENE.GHVP01020664.1~~GHVP01020664.1.p1  ORF type:complete len:1415 (+),score=266.26 GHVP01020664.1:1437-5681(+)
MSFTSSDYADLGDAIIEVAQTQGTEDFPKTVMHVFEELFFKLRSAKDIILSVDKIVHQLEDDEDSLLEQKKTLSYEIMKVPRLLKEAADYTRFLLNMYIHVENEVIRKCIQMCCGPPLLGNLSEDQRNHVLSYEIPSLHRNWKNFSKRLSSTTDPEKLQNLKFSVCAMDNVIEYFIEFMEYLLPVLMNLRDTLEVTCKNESLSLGGQHNRAFDGSLDYDELLYIERTTELLTDLLCQRLTRICLRPVLLSKQILLRAFVSKIMVTPETHLLKSLIEKAKYYLYFEVDDETGEPKSFADMEEKHYARINNLQVLCFRFYNSLKSNSNEEQQPNNENLDIASSEEDNLKESFRKISLLPARKVSQELPKLLDVMPIEFLLELNSNLHLLNLDFVNSVLDETRSIPIAESSIPGDTSKMQWNGSNLKSLFVKSLMEYYEKRKNLLDELNQLPLVPSEEELWDPTTLPTDIYKGDYSLALPKLNLQFLTIHDYLQRNFELYKLESCYDIRESLQDTIYDMRPIRNPIRRTPELMFSGSSPMAVALNTFSIVSTKEPKIGHNVPSEVRAEITIDLKEFTPAIRQEWDNLRPHDVLFAVALLPVDEICVARPSSLEKATDFLEKFGLLAVRSCEVTAIVDEEGNVITDPNLGEALVPVGTQRTIRCFLDPCQYLKDIEVTLQKPGFEDLYGTFNLLVRRKAVESNFKAVLETIRTLMNEPKSTIIPDWLHDHFLGYLNPGLLKSLKKSERRIDYLDTFLNNEHLKSCFADFEVSFDNASGPPYVLNFDYEENTIKVTSYSQEKRGPYPQCSIRQNKIYFTPAQCQAIHSAVNAGLSVIVGPPGTGKTDTAVQAVSLLLKNFPQQKTLLLARTNQALNDLFEKIAELDVDERYLLRLGVGEKELREGSGAAPVNAFGYVGSTASGRNYSKVGRVNHMLQRRLDLLRLVTKLAESLEISGDYDTCCATALEFFTHHVQWRINLFQSLMSDVRNGSITVKEAIESTQEEARARGASESAVEEISAIFTKGGSTNTAALFPFSVFFEEISDLFPADEDKAFEAAESCFRWFDDLKLQIQECRAFELAALTRSHLLSINFKYDNIVMEESAQILEIESFIPMVLQNIELGASRLKRVILIGDHHQLPPVTKNPAYRTFGKFDQSLFTRFIRLGTPHLLLDRQGRMRPTLRNIFSWKYSETHPTGLGDLPHVVSQPEYRLANPGLAHEFQFINVENFEGRGETCPHPHYFQNRGEAEYIAAFFMYLCLIGYPREKISIICTYNGQKDMIRDVISQRCGWNPVIGWPSKITTVDKYQGQQNEIVIVSMVRTSQVGHVSQPKRVLVACSRARLGLYVFGRQRLFHSCRPLKKFMDRFGAKPNDLEIVQREQYGQITRKVEDTSDTKMLVKGVHEMREVVKEIARKIVG